MLIKQNKRFQSLFKDFMKNRSSYSSYNSNYNYNYSSITIYFYEWSDIYGKTRYFYSIDSFCEYLKKYKIYYTDEQIKQIKRSHYCYCSCIPGKPLLMVELQYCNLRDKLIDLKKQTDVCTSIAVINKS